MCIHNSRRFWSYRQIILGLLISVMCHVPYAVAAANEIVIDNAPFQSVSTPVRLSLITIRTMTDPNFLYNTKVDEIRFSSDLILNAAMMIPELKEYLDTVDPDMLDFSSIKEAIAISGYDEKYLFDTGSYGNIARSDLSGIGTSSEYNKNMTWDAITLLNMISTGVLNIDDVSYNEYQGKLIKNIKFDRKYAEKIALIYKNLSLVNLSDSPILEISDSYDSITNDVREYDSIERSLLSNVGEITFGRPILYTKEERELAVPQSVDRDSDVYWMDLAVTFRDMLSKNLTEMVVNFALPEGSNVLELAPLEYGSLVTKQRTTSSPEIGIQSPAGARITVGEFFKTTVSYSYLRPTVIAYGLGEKRFSWNISGEALRAGSHRFVAVVAVPKGSDGVDLAMSGHVRLSPLFGTWFDGNLIAGTETKIVPISF